MAAVKWPQRSIYTGMSTAKLIETLSGIGRPRLLVVGDLILDEYVWGEVERVSPEAPIPVLKVERREQRPGGAGSVVVNLAALGAEVHVLSAVGADEVGEQLLDRLRRDGCSVDLVASIPDRRTTLKARHLGYVQHADRAVQQLLRVDTEDVEAVPGEYRREILARFKRYAGDFDAVLISDYDKGLLSDAFTQELIRVAQPSPVIADPARLNRYDRYRGAELICPNRYETARAASMVRCQDVNACAEAGTRLAAEGFRYVAVTMDRDGICLCREGREARHFATEVRNIADVTGAGDMVLSVLGLSLGAGCPVEEAVQLANVAAGIEVRRMGCTPVLRAELMQELLFRGHSGAAKLKTLKDLVPTVQQIQASGRAVVFTNGCFDLLHFGHHHLLNQAKRLGDCLIVAVNSDTSVRRIKGANRPLTTERERMLMLSGLECVDYVIIFDDDTPVPLLQELRPDVLVKGSEYRDGTVVGREIVESYGGRVELIEQIPGISTTAILGREGEDGPDSSNPAG